MEPPEAGAPAVGSPGVSIPPARTQPRVRFPAPYSPAGSTQRSPGIDASPRATNVPGSVTPAPPKPALSSSGSRGAGELGNKGSRQQPDSGPEVRYNQGPTRRVAPPKPLDRAPKTAPPTPPTVTPKSGKGGSEPRAGVKPTGKLSNWRDVRRTDPASAREILVGTKLAGRGFEVGVGVATGAIGGGVSAGGYRGGDLDDSWVCDPYGWNGSSSCGYYGYYWGASCGWSSLWYPFYWSWYYPCWWWYSQPYYYNDYYFYRPVSTVVYSEPQVIYLERESEPVGEGVVSAPPAGTIAPPAAAESPLTIAAQRYLELGDRAFREGRYTDSVQFYAKAVEFAPDQGALYLVLSDALFASGDYHYGAYAVRRALELDPALVQSQIDKHGFYPDPQQFDEQLASLESYLNAHPSDRDARLVLALNYLFGARAKDAVRVLESAAAAMADDPASQKILNRAREAGQD